MCISSKCVMNLDKTIACNTTTNDTLLQYLSAEGMHFGMQKRYWMRASCRKCVFAPFCHTNV